MKIIIFFIYNYWYLLIYLFICHNRKTLFSLIYANLLSTEKNSKIHVDSRITEIMLETRTI